MKNHLLKLSSSLKNIKESNAANKIIILAGELYEFPAKQSDKDAYSNSLLEEIRMLTNNLKSTSDPIAQQDLQNQIDNLYDIISTLEEEGSERTTSIGKLKLMLEKDNSLLEVIPTKPVDYKKLLNKVVVISGNQKDNKIMADVISEVDESIPF